MTRRLATLTLRLAFVSVGLLVATSASAGLLGFQVTGEIYFGANPDNYFDPAFGLVPAGFSNTAGATVAIGDPAVEFGFQDGANRDIADFTDSQLFISDEVFSSAFPWMMRFTSVTPGLFTSLSLVSETFSPGLTYSLVGNAITINWAGTSSPANFSGVFNVGSPDAPVPEPATLLLLGAGVAGLAARRRRRAR